MARFNVETADRYGGNGGTGFFSLKNDGDVATVRFLYNDEGDVEGYAVHEVEIDGKKRWVNCLREYNQPIDDCPFCKAKKYQAAKIFIPLYNVDEDKVQIWERGKTFFSKLSGLFARYSKSSIVSQTFEIERHGIKGDTKTQYEIYRTDEPADDTTLEDFETPKLLGGFILDKSADDMEFYLDNNYFPPEDDETPTSRRSSRRRDEEDEAPRRRESASRRSSRRTPANEDVY